MKLTDEQRQMQQEIHEWGQIERDYAELADFSPHGGWFFRVFKWMEGHARGFREDAKDELEDTAESARRAIAGETGG